MQFQGERRFPLAPAPLFALLGDARFLVACIPDTENVRAPSADEAHCALRPSLSFMKGTLQLALQVVERQAPTMLRFVLTNKSIGAGAEVEGQLRFEAEEQGTRVAWQATISRLTGLLKMVPTGLIRGAAQKVIEDVWGHVEQRVHQQSASQPAV